MQAVRLHDHGGPEVLEVAEVDRPRPGGHELLVEVAAAGVNPVDTYFRDGSYTPVDVPFTPGVDLAGVVAEVGEYVEGFEAGDRVYGTGIGTASAQGAYAEYATVPEDRIVHLPEGIDLIEAGAAGVAAVTAWRALIDHAGLDPAECCLVHGGSGGVGHVAVQIGAAVRAQVLATADPEYHDAVCRLGAETTLDYGRDDLAEALREAVEGGGDSDGDVEDEGDGEGDGEDEGEGRGEGEGKGEGEGETAPVGVDVVLDHRLDDYLQFDAEVAAEGARVVGIGENRSDPAFSNVRVARSKDVNYQFMSVFNTPDFRVPLRGVAHLLDAGALSIEVARRYSLDEASRAHRDVLEESFLGKLVIQP